jgi:serpin B
MRTVARSCALLALCALIAPAAAGGRASSAQSRAAPAPVPTVARSIGDFGSDFYRAVRHGNTVVSPFSLEYALAGLYVGSAHSTRSELARVLHAPPLVGPFVTGLRELDRSVNVAGGDGGDRPQLTSANALWADLGATPKPGFVAATGAYGAELRQTDFRNAPAAAVDAINQWAADHTAGRITNIFDPSSITAATRLVIANAVYFKGRWQSEFAPGQTRPQAFHRLRASAVRVPTMHRSGKAFYTEGDGWQAVQLAYLGSRASMLIIVPRTSIGRIERRLSSGFLAAIDRRLEEARVTLALPRFELRGNYDLRAALKRLGATGTVGSSPDLTGIFEGIAPGDLRLGAGVHKTFMHVDEQGTEAAAVTVQGAEATSIPSKEVTVTADRPFVAVIQENSTGVPLFLARVMDPSRR